MNDEYSELNDIILNRHKKSGTRKKMLIGIGLLAIVAIVIVVIMGRMSGSAPAQLAQSLPSAPKPAAQQPIASEVAPAPAEPAPAAVTQQPTGADASKSTVPQTPVSPAQGGVTVIDETQSHPTTEAPEHAPIKPVVTQPVAQPEPVSPPVTKKVVTQPKPKPAVKSTIYIQVGSFTKYKPSRTFLAAIKRSGYDYTYHRVVLNGKIVNKVLVGPFKDREDALAHLADVRRNIEPGAFIYTKK